MSAEQNKAIVRHMLHDLWGGNLDVLNDHPGLHESIPFITELMASVDFSSQEIVQQLGEGDWVVTRFLSTGTNHQDFMGMPAGTESHMETIMLHRIEDGLIVEQRAQGGPYQRR